jgi:hypothetical protein
MGSTFTAGFLCNFPADSHCFGQKPPTPHQGATISVTGCISGPCITTQGDEVISCMLINVQDIGFLASDSGSLPATPVKRKGKSSTFSWLTESPSTPVASTSKESMNESEVEQSSAPPTSPKKRQQVKEESMTMAACTCLLSINISSLTNYSSRKYM